MGSFTVVHGNTKKANIWVSKPVLKNMAQAFLRHACGLTKSRFSSWTSLTMKIMSKRDKMVGMKSMFSSALVSSQRPKTLLAAASTEHLELRVVVIPALNDDDKRKGIERQEGVNVIY